MRGPDASAWRLLQGVVYTKSLQTGWKPRAKYRAMREDAHQDFRDKFHIICEGDNLPPPVSRWPALPLPGRPELRIASVDVSQLLCNTLH